MQRCLLVLPPERVGLGTGGLRILAPRPRRSGTTHLPLPSQRVFIQPIKNSTHPVPMDNVGRNAHTLQHPIHTQANVALPRSSVKICQLVPQFLKNHVELPDLLVLLLHHLPQLLRLLVRFCPRQLRRGAGCFGPSAWRLGWVTPRRPRASDHQPVVRSPVGLLFLHALLFDCRVRPAGLPADGAGGPSPQRGRRCRGAASSAVKLGRLERPLATGAGNTNSSPAGSCTPRSSSSTLRL
mmetsp:Transcript_47341/g.107404  ORF Transcript_47341/g.107404 Transcript_47341/m.107404 type:complete len:239 (-) Transcript_47341:839-1555(-)